MTITDIMLRDMMEAERQQREDAEEAATGISKGRALVRMASACFGVLAVALLAFIAWCIASDTPHVFPTRVQTSR